MGTESRSVPKRKGLSVEAAAKWLAEHYLGLLLVLVVAYASVRLGAAFPLIGAPVFGIVLGMVLRTAVGVPEGCRAGVKWSGKRILQIAIVLLGAGYSLDKIWAAGAESIGLILMVLAIAFVITLGAGRFLGVESNLRHLIAFGTAFCGASAIAAVSPVIAPKERDVSYAITTVFLCSLVAVVAFPLIGHALGLPELDYGLWAGTSINDTSSTVAAGFAYGEEAGQVATVVKLSRTLMLVPALIIFSFISGRQGQRRTAGRFRLGKLVPWFLVGFLLASVLRTTGVFSPALGDSINAWGRYAVVAALTGVGLGTDLREMRQVSWQPMVLGVGAWLVMACASLFVVMQR